jgi:hypothetical protein
MAYSLHSQAISILSLSDNKAQIPHCNPILGVQRSIWALLSDRLTWARLQLLYLNTGR